MRRIFCWVYFLFIFFSIFPGRVYALGPIDGFVYGRLNVSYQNEHNAESGSVWKLESNASRLGFKGKTSVENSLALLYQIEYGVEVDDGDKNGQTVSQRDTFVGIQGEWGRLKGGRITIPFKEAKGGFDLFNDLQGELGKIIDGEERLDNVLQYDSRQFLGPLALVLAIVPGENPDEGDEDGPADGVSGSLGYSQNQLYVNVGFNVDIKQQDQLRLVAGWRSIAIAKGSLNVGALYQRSKISDSEISFIDGEDKANAYGVSAAYSLQGNTFKAQYIDSDRSIARSDASQFSLGVDHMLGKRSLLYGYYTRRDADEKDQRNRYIAIGIKHPF